MTGLETAFYIIAIIFMSLNFLIMIALVVSVLVIRSKVNKIHDQIESKIDALTSLAGKGGELTALASEAVVKTAKKAMRKASKK